MALMDLAQAEALALLGDLLARDTAVRFTVTGNSMRPRLMGGTTVLLRRVPPDRIRRGDLVLCRQPGTLGQRLILHRVVAIRRCLSGSVLLQTQGDALAAPDPPVTGAQVLGRVSAVLGNTPDAEMTDLESRTQRALALAIALYQRTLWRARSVYVRFRRLAVSQSTTYP